MNRADAKRAREVERQEWNAALASGDADRIKATRDRILRAVAARIMDDDPNYAGSGWTPSA